MSTKIPKITTNLRHPTNSEKSSTLIHSELMAFNYQKKISQKNLGKYRKNNTLITKIPGNKETWHNTQKNSNKSHTNQKDTLSQS